MASADDDVERTRRAEHISKHTLDDGEHLRSLDPERYRKRVGIDASTKVFILTG